MAKHHLKLEKSSPAIFIPDVVGTVEWLIEVIERSALPLLQGNTETHLVVADKQPRVLKLPVLPSATGLLKPGEMPGVRPAEKLRDHWMKGSGFDSAFIYIVRGEADLLLCRRVVACHAGNFVFLPPKTWRNQGNASHWERPALEQADSDILWAFFNQDGISIHLCKSRGARHAISPVLHIPDHGSFALVELFSEEVFNGEITQAVTQLLWLLFDRVLRKLQKKRVLPSEHLTRSRPSEVPLQSVGERAQRYVEANLGEKLTLSIVARAVHVSRTQLTQKFAAHTGETFGAYLLRRRLEQAQHLLETTTMAIDGISWMCGFSNPHYFSTAFSRRIGMTPTQFRAVQKRNDK